MCTPWIAVPAAGGAFADTRNPINESQTLGYDHIPAFSKSRKPLSSFQVIETVRLLRRSKVATPKANENKDDQSLLRYMEHQLCPKT